jgi:hypothetical protein
MPWGRFDRRTAALLQIRASEDSHVDLRYLRDHVGPEYLLLVSRFGGTSEVARRLRRERHDSPNRPGVRSYERSRPGATQSASAPDPGPLSFPEKMPSEARALALLARRSRDRR